jgi:hypothetical protein
VGLVCEVVAGWILFVWADQIARGQLGDGSRHPRCRGFFDSEFVVAAADVRHEAVPGADHPCAVELCEAAHLP